MKISVKIGVLFLFLAILRHGMANTMFRREAKTPVAEENEENAIANETEVTGAEDSSDTEASEAETGITEDEPKETEDEPKETEDEPKETEDESDESDESDEEDIWDEDDDALPDIGFQTGIVFGSPYVSLRQMQQYFFELERALHKVFENTLKEAALNPDSNSTSSTEEVTVGGHKYLVNRTVIAGGDDDSSVVIKTITIVPTEDRRKRAVFALA